MDKDKILREIKQEALDNHVPIIEDDSLEYIENIPKMGLEDKIEVILTDAGEYMKQIPTEEKYDIIFIDAAKGQYLVYLEEAIRLSHSGTIIIADNMLYRGRTLSDYNEHKHRTATNRLREYLEIMKEDPRLESELIMVGDGLAISKVK